MYDEPTPFGRAVRDEARGDRTAPLWQHTDEGRREHPVREFYLTDRPASDYHEWQASWLDTPLVDLGAGAGRDTLAFQRRGAAVGVEADPALVETMRGRGVDEAVHADMFDPPADLADRFDAALVYGTQAGLAGSPDALAAFLDDLARVTTAGATAVVDAYDPTTAAARDLDGFAALPDEGLARREMWFSYEGERGPTLSFLLFSPARLREAASGTPWRVAETYRHDSGRHYSAALAR